MKRAILIYCLLTFGISWGAKFVFCAEDMGWIITIVPKGILQILASYGPTLAGLIIYYLEYDKKGLAAVLESLAKVNVHLKWYLFTLFFELGSFLIIVLFAHLAGYKETLFRKEELGSSFLMFVVNIFTLTLLTGLGEEVGWRGFLLPKLQSRFKVIYAGIILSLIISLWHLRTDLLKLLMQGDYDGFVMGYLPDMGQRILITIPVVFIISYLFNKTRGSLFIMILFHGSANASWEWVKQVTGNADPSYLLTLWMVLLWLTAVFSIPALNRQAKGKQLVTSILE